MTTGRSPLALVGEDIAIALHQLHAEEAIAQVPTAPSDRHTGGSSSAKIAHRLAQLTLLLPHVVLSRQSGTDFRQRQNRKRH